MDETDGIGKQNLSAVWQGNTTSDRVKRAKRFVFRRYICPAQCIKQGAFTGVGITNQSNYSNTISLSLSTIKCTMSSHSF